MPDAMTEEWTRIPAPIESEAYRKAIQKLAAYEDTGLEPEEIKAIGPIDRLRELAQADKDGRCLVLPCKVGGTLWMVVTNYSKIPEKTYSFVKRSELSWLNMERVIQDFDKTVFLTREEAEKALEGMKNV